MNILCDKIGVNIGYSHEDIIQGLKGRKTIKIVSMIKGKLFFFLQKFVKVIIGFELCQEVLKEVYKIMLR